MLQCLASGERCVSAASLAWRRWYWADRRQRAVELYGTSAAQHDNLWSHLVSRFGDLCYWWSFEVAFIETCVGHFPGNLLLWLCCWSSKTTDTKFVCVRMMFHIQMKGFIGSDPCFIHKRLPYSRAIDRLSDASTAVECRVKCDDE